MSAQQWFTYQGTDIFHVGDTGAYSYKTGHVELDADGCPTAYHPDDTGLDFLANAGFPDGGWRSVLVVDPQDPSRPFVQQEGPAKGFFLSMTTLRDPTLPATDPAKYVDAITVPYIVFPGAFHALAGTGTWGDVVMVRALGASDLQSAAIVADGGPTDAPLGETRSALPRRSAAITRTRATVPAARSACSNMSSSRGPGSGRPGAGPSPTSRCRRRRCWTRSEAGRRSEASR